MDRVLTFEDLVMIIETVTPKPDRAALTGREIQTDALPTQLWTRTELPGCGNPGNEVGDETVAGSFSRTSSGIVICQVGWITVSALRANVAVGKVVAEAP